MRPRERMLMGESRGLREGGEASRLLVHWLIGLHSEERVLRPLSKDVSRGKLLLLIHLVLSRLLLLLLGHLLLPHDPKVEV